MKKGSGGAVALTENPTVFKKWMIAGPEQSRPLKEFEQRTIQQKETSMNTMKKACLVYTQTYQRREQ